MREEWKGFKVGDWCDEINVRDFILSNFTLYEGDDTFLQNATDATIKLAEIVNKLNEEERKAGGVLDADTDIVSTITSHNAGYINKDLEKIVGLQTDKPLKRALHVFGGIRSSESALTSYGYELNPVIKNTAAISGIQNPSFNTPHIITAKQTPIEAIIILCASVNLVSSL